MTDPLSLFPVALAAGGGTIDGLECQQLVAAGLTLLRRSAPLVRALSGRRSGILLMDGPAFLVALAASDGRGAVLIDPVTAPQDAAWQLSDANVGAVFTTKHLAPRLPPDVPLVLLDDVPRSARFVSIGTDREIDLGSHVGLELEGSRDAEGLDEECVVVYEPGAQRPVVLSHRHLIANARSALPRSATVASPDSPLAPLASFASTLMSGGNVTTSRTI